MCNRYSESRLVYQWDSVDSSITLSALSQEQLLTDISSPNLVLARDLLLPGATYTFDLTAEVSGVDYLEPGWASLTVVTNSPPALGSCSVTLSAEPLGLSELRCSEWTDDSADLPLQYQFGYLTRDTSSFFALTDWQTSPSTSIQLPVGPLEIQARVVDNKHAQAVYTMSVDVPTADLSEDGALEDATDSLLGGAEQALALGDLNAFSQLTALTLSLLPDENGTTDSTGSSEGSQDSSVSQVQAVSTTLRERLFNLTRALAQTASSQTTNELVVSLVASTCERSDQLTPEVRLGSLNLLSETAQELQTYGPLATTQTEQMLYTVSQVVSSFVAAPASSALSVSSFTQEDSEEVREEQLEFAEAVFSLALNMTAGVASGMVAYQQPSVQSSARVSLQSQVRPPTPTSHISYIASFSLSLSL